MYCLRCGRDAKDDHVFCDLCQQDMEAYPVKPGTAVHLPHRDTAVVVKKKSRKKRPTTPEEQVSSLRRSLRRSRVFATVLILLLGLAVAALYYGSTLLDEPIIGRNYTINITQPTE